MLLMSSMLISMLISMLLLSGSSSAPLLISWFELVHPIYSFADRIFRWVEEQSLMIVTPCSHAYHRNDVLIRFLVNESLPVCWSCYHIHSTHSEIPSSFFNVIHTVVIHPEVGWQLKAVRGWFSVYRSQNVCQTFLTLHHFLRVLHQSHSIFRTWLMYLRRPLDVFSGSVMWRKVPGLCCPWSVVDHYHLFTRKTCRSKQPVSWSWFTQSVVGPL